MTDDLATQLEHAYLQRMEAIRDNDREKWRTWQVTSHELRVLLGIHLNDPEDARIYGRARTRFAEESL